MKLELLYIVLSFEKAIWQYVLSHKNVHTIDRAIHLLKWYPKEKSLKEEEKSFMYKGLHSHLETA